MKAVPLNLNRYLYPGDPVYDDCRRIWNGMIDRKPAMIARCAATSDVDSHQRIATAQPGLLWGEFDRATTEFGLATTGGQVSHTGIAGLTLGGGLGYMMGLHGATCDNLLSAEAVTAEGEIVQASR